MCGVVGMFSYGAGSSGVDRDELRRIRDHMTRRGPDGSGEWYASDGRVGLGHRRLSIIDLSERGTQPMKSHDGTLVISYNGEIYNYRELREDLIRQGCTFNSDSDTEVILQLYAKYGTEALRKLRGMFSFVLWDEKSRTMLLARDPYGIKPLYYADDGNMVRVASSVKGLIAGGKVSKTQSPAGVTGFFLWGSVPEPYTIYESIRALPAGHLMRVTEGGISDAEEYASIEEVFKNAENRRLNRYIEDPLHLRLRGALRDSIKHHLVSDVPVGVFLSAGIDSGALVAMAAKESSQPLRTMTLSFEEFRNTEHDEAPLARMLSERYGTRHVEKVLTRREFEQDLEKVLEAMDQPTIDGLNTYFISKMAAEQGLKVALSGLGGDELFGGYPSFQQIPSLVSAMRIPSHVPLLGGAFAGACSLVRMLIPSIHPKTLGMVKFGGTYAGAYFLKRGLFMPWELPKVMKPDMAAEGLKHFSSLAGFNGFIKPGLKTPYSRIAVREASLYMRNQLLRDADWAGMAHSVEIRTPYVDFEFLKRMAGPVIRQQKIAAKEDLAQAPEQPLPDEITNRAKTGFSLPMADWLQGKERFCAWKDVALLKHETNHWSRRWAYAVCKELSSAA
ncbi:MAG: asparagine synthase (glutamine-hydrolyzing) [Candidatus Omnitrophota bacterium]|nr:asparagine synthase (glutamine-hydrolyzing) [Candidatus Omnitrophota bacterium]